MNAPFSPQLLRPTLPSRRGELTWEIAELFPAQGEWTETQYLALQTNRLIELSDGCLEFLPMPTPYHQDLVEFFYILLREFVLARNLGKVYFAPMPVRLWPGKFRDPDVVLLRPDQLADRHRQPQGAELVMEVVSEGEEARECDLKTKRAEYAQAGIKEYWIVDPELSEVTVLALDGKEYRVHGVFKRDQVATSALFPDFTVPVGPLFDAGENAANNR